MSRIEPPSGAEVPTDNRLAMTPARKRLIWQAWGGKCWFCRMPIEESGPTVVYDHVNPLWLAGSDANEAIGPIHAKPCNKIKTAADAKRIAKTKRQAKACLPRDPDDIPVSKLRSRGFPKHLSRGFDGRVKPRGSRS